MKGLLKTSGFKNWRVVYLKDNSTEDKINILQELGYGVKDDNGNLVPYYLDDNTIVDTESTVFKTIDEIFLYMDKEGWLQDLDIAILDIDGEEVDIQNITLNEIQHKNNGDSYYEYDLSTMSELEKIALIREVDFSVIKQVNGVFRLLDLQGGNLAGIEYERFHSIDSIIDRLDNYWNDYSIRFKDSF